MYVIGIHFCDCNKQKINHIIDLKTIVLFHDFMTFQSMFQSNVLLYDWTNKWTLLMVILMAIPIKLYRRFILFMAVMFPLTRCHHTYFLGHCLVIWSLNKITFYQQFLTILYHSNIQIPILCIWRIVRY